jgi:hypothetical protein
MEHKITLTRGIFLKIIADAVADLSGVDVDTVEDMEWKIIVGDIFDGPADEQVLTFVYNSE